MKGLTLTTVFLAIAGCATAPKTASEKHQLDTEVSATLTAMIQKDADLRPTLDRAAGYAVFPDIGKGGFVVGAAYGKGILYDHGHKIGYVELNQASVGAQVGGQSFSELIVFLRSQDVQSLKNGEFSVGGNVSAVALRSGAVAGADLTQGVAVFVETHGGAMAELSVSGQKINFEPLSG